jgi:Tol biopolymer transport system component
MKLKLFIATLLICAMGCDFLDDDGKDLSGPSDWPDLFNEEGTLAYQKEPDLDSSISVVRAETAWWNIGEGVHPSISADGSKVAYSGIDRSIHINDLDHKPSRVLPSGYTNQMDWSPDGTMLVYRGSWENENGSRDQGIFIINADGSGRRKISSNLGFPTWSPNGKIYYSLVRSIYSISANGANEVLLKSFNDTLVVGIDASPDGEKLAFVVPEGNRANAYTMDIDGTNLRRLFDDDEDGVVNTHSLCWSPNGEKLAFSFGGILYSTPLYDAGMTKLRGEIRPDFRGYRPSWGR